MDSNTPNIGVLMVHIHNAVTRGLDVAIERSAAFIKDGYPDAKTQDSFITYARTLGLLINAHHLTEDNVVFPYLRLKLPKAPFKKLSADHKKMDGLLKDIQIACNMMAVQPQGGEPLKNLNIAVTGISEIWHPHIAIELFNIYEAKRTEDVMSTDEQIKLMTDAAMYSMKEGDPGYMVPFILYNLQGDDRAYMEHTLPAPFLKELIPVVWKNKWEPMKPFILD
jgi:hemerythrin-like domain-containing protein